MAAGAPHTKVTLCHAHMCGLEDVHVVLGDTRALTKERESYKIMRVTTHDGPLQVGDKVSVMVHFNVDNIHIVEVVRQGTKHTQPRKDVQFRVIENVVVNAPSSAGAEEDTALPCHVCRQESMLSHAKLVDLGRGCAMCTVAVCPMCQLVTPLGQRLKTHGLCITCSTAGSNDV